MSDKAGGGGHEQMPQMTVPNFEGIKLEPLPLKEHSKAMEDIASLPWDALNASELPVSSGERINDLRELFPQSQTTSNHLKLFVLRGEYGIDGFVAMNADVGEHVGTLTHVWLSHKRHQAGELAEILRSSEDHLRNFGCTRGIINAPRPMSTLKQVGSHTESSKFWTFKSGEDEEPKAVLEKAA